MQETVAYEEIEFKDIKKAERILRSEAARTRRKELKLVKDVREENEWAKQRRQRQHLKKIARKHNET
jgi:hypothetical protein